MQLRTPDLFPPLVALAASCNGTTVIEGVSRLANKESNRGLTLQEEFAKLGVVITLQDDLMLVEGGKGLHGATVHSRHDHTNLQWHVLLQLYKPMEKLTLKKQNPWINHTPTFTIIYKS